VDGVPARARTKLDGPQDVALQLTVDQGGLRREAVVLRTRLAPASVQAVPGPDATAWLRIASFRTGAAREMDQGLSGLGPVTGVVLDLRQTPGGALEEAVAVADRFLGVGEIVRVEGRGPGVAKTYASTDAANDITVPLVVLVDGGTASAAEIVAGALKARGRAKLVGSPTFGKGSVQTWLHQSDGSTAKLTIGRYVLPDGARPDVGAGLTPDIKVELPAVASPLGRVKDRVRAVPGLSPSDRAALLAEVEAAGSTVARPGLPSFGPPIDDRITLDGQLAAAFEALHPTTP
jgi:carboxyl-terminal processing protease